MTQDFGDPGDIALVTGVVYEDLNANSFYDIGEGRSGVRIDLEDSAYYAISSSSGGYTLPAAGDGIFDVMFSGGGFSPFTTTATISGLLNVKIDYLAQMIASNPADFDNDGDVDGQDLVQWRTDFGGPGSDADDDGDTDGNDFLVWQQQLAAPPGLTSSVAAPEPHSLALLIASALMLLLARRPL